MRTLFLSCVALVSLAGIARADDFLQSEGVLWRASKLVGVNIYGPDKRKVGDINDVLMGKDGKAVAVVVGVGGFLGIGEKDVAIPFGQVTFTQEPMPMPAPIATDPATAPMANGAMPGMAPAGTTTNTGVAPNTTVGLGTPAVTDDASMANPVNSGMANRPAPRSTAYPDHGTVTYTADQLKAAPTFSYAK